MIGDGNPRGTAIDLKAAAVTLKSDYPKAAGLIHKLVSAHSIRSDLGMALDMMNALDEVLPIARRGGTNWASNSALSLINSAVVFYVRATKSSSKHRSGIDFRKEFSEAEIETHDKLSKLRDDAIAHFGPGDEYGGPPWQREGVFLPIDRPNDLRIMTASRRIIMQQQLQQRMKIQIHRAVLIAERECQLRNAALAKHLNELAVDETFVELVQGHKVDLLEFFETEEALENAIGGLRRQRRSGVVEH